MNIIAVDDELLALENIVSLVKKNFPKAAITGFQTPAEALSYLSENEVHIALLDIEMGNMDGITFAKKCKYFCQNINIIFVTGHAQYAMDALQLHSSGYLLKPVRTASLCHEFNNLRYPIPVSFSKRVKIQTFGNFEVFADKVPLRFPMAKCKECFAYLIDRRGACATTAELAAILWEDRPYDKTVQNNTHRVISDLMKTLHKANIKEIIIKTRKEISIDVNQADCDYYRFLEGDVSAINSFHGEYMRNYSWSEFTLGELIRSRTF